MEEAAQARWAVQEKASAGQAQERAKQSSGRASVRLGAGLAGGRRWGKGCGRWRALGALPSLLAREPEARTERNVQVEVAQ